MSITERRAMRAYDRAIEAEARAYDQYAAAAATLVAHRLAGSSDLAELERRARIAHDAWFATSRHIEYLAESPSEAYAS